MIGERTKKKKKNVKEMGARMKERKIKKKSWTKRE